MSKRLNPVIVDAPQRSDEWFKARLGKVTGSMAAAPMSYYVPTKKMIDLAIIEHQKMETPQAIIEKLNDKYPTELVVSAGIEIQEKADRMNYRRNIVGERLTGVPANPDQFTTYAMRWGIISEHLALALYQLKSRSIIDDAPLMLHPTLKCGASPDSLVTDPTTGLLGNVECKCLMTANHLYKIIRERQVPEEYIPQIQMQMWINGRDFCDFVGFDSRLPDGLQIYIERVERDDFYIDYVLSPAIERFLDECDKDFRQFFAQLTDKGRAVSSLISREFTEGVKETEQLQTA